MTREERNADLSDRTQPSLARLTRDIRASREALLAGFDSRRAVLEWCVGTIAGENSAGALAATLGHLPPSFIDGLHEEFITDSSSAVGRPPLLGGLLRNDEAVPNADARTLRNRLVASVFAPAASRAVGALRDDAQEVAPASDEPTVDVQDERHVARRPSLTSIEKHQARALRGLLTGFDSVDALYRWGDVLDLATHSEIPDTYLTSVATSPTTRQLLIVENSEEHQEAREVIAAWLLRYFAAGTRSRFHHAAEASEAESNDTSAPDW